MKKPQTTRIKYEYMDQKLLQAYKLLTLAISNYKN